MLLKIKHIFLAVIYFKIIYCFFASSPWYKAFHIKSRNVAIKAFGAWELNHKTGSGAQGKAKEELNAGRSPKETNKTQKKCFFIYRREKSIRGYLTSN